MYMNECNICFDRNAIVNCFGACSIKLCLNCFNTILKLNVCKDIEYVCPQCRVTSIKNKDRRFTTFVNKHKSTLKKIISLYETRTVDTAWNVWRQDISFNIYHMSNEQVAELTYYDYDENLPD
jgi:hypothetical protein